MTIILVCFMMTVDFYAGLRAAEKVCDGRFLSPFELLFLDWVKPKLQSQFDIVTPRFVLGMSRRERYCFPHRAAQRTLSATESFDREPVDAFARFALTPKTDLDRGTFEEWLDRQPGIPSSSLLTQ